MFLGFSSRADTAPVSSVFDLLTGQEIVEVTLRTDLGQLLAQAEATPTYQSGLFSFSPPGQGSQSWNIKVKARGKFRRQVCDFPPLMLNFSRVELENRGFSGHDKLKLVTHCAEDRIVGNEKVLREYLAYQLYRELSPYSYRVQLVSIQYIDSKGLVSGFKRLGFIIEDTDEMAERLQGEECDDCQYRPVAAFDQQAAGIHAMFQYLIGNADYSVPVLRNVKVVRRTLDQKLVPVGYDFDFSGLVEASYAIPANYLGQLAVRQRIYLGPLTADADMKQQIELFFAKKETLLRVVDNFKKLSSPARYDIREYLLNFYEQMQMIRDTGYHNVYQRLRQEHPTAVPDGGTAADYGVVSK
ncbi:MAG: hypothetical protein DA408_13710 [Bacteroidetes bacterium]|nr:MAG: hypothetical protein C7N36_04520 [Bacteroidota bacterium]PTM11376.1 MAG: hypothetical protein DA408_13710 [Bacteroidota bacterium]